jgi:endonuclease I
MFRFKQFLISVCVCIVSFAHAQHPIQISQSSINFGVGYENTPSYTDVTFINNWSNPVTFDSVYFYKFLNYNHFYTSDSVFTIQPGASKTVTIYFKPLHNMGINSEIVFRNNSGFGPIVIDVKGQGRYAKSYYSTTENLEAEALKLALRTRLNQGYTNLGYTGSSSVRVKMFELVDNWMNNGREPTLTISKTECVYTGRQITGYPYNTGTINNSPYSMNTEHTWPQSLGSQNDPMQSDMFHLYPVDGATNSLRSNDPYGVVTGGTTTLGGSKSGGGKFEPRDVHKGNVARSIFYYVVKYGNQAAVAPNVPTFLGGMESVLRTWYRQYPPDAVQMRRNSDIYALQNCRNPFIDYPQFIERINSFTNTANIIITKSIDVPEQTANFGDVKIGTAKTYGVVVVNNGRDTVTLSNFSLSGSSSFSLATSTPASIMINPGESAIIPVVCNAVSGMMGGTLTFSTDINAFPTYSVALNANGNTSVVENYFAQRPLMVYPNPAGQQSYVFCEAREMSQGATPEFQLLNTLGQTLNVSISRIDAEHFAIQVDHLPIGTYHLKVTDKKAGVVYQSTFIR